MLELTVCASPFSRVRPLSHAQVPPPFSFISSHLSISSPASPAVSAELGSLKQIICAICININNWSTVYTCATRLTAPAKVTRNNKSDSQSDMCKPCQKVNKFQVSLIIDPTNFNKMRSTTVCMQTRKCLAGCEA